MAGLGLEATAKQMNGKLIEEVSVSYTTETGETITKTGRGVHLRNIPNKWVLIFEEE